MAALRELPPIRSWLYVPGNRPDRIEKAFAAGADAVIIDLEDAVPGSEKDSARRSAAAAVDARPRAGPATFVRIDTSADWREDVAAVVRPGLDGLRIPKAEDASTVASICSAIARAEREADMSDGSVRVVCGIETARGVWHAVEIASADARVVALSFGAADFARDVGIQPDSDGTQTLYARSSLVISSRVAGILPPIESVQTDVRDLERLARTTRQARALGFFGRSVIHPAQVPVVNAAFTPDEDEIARAREVIAAAERADRERSGATTTAGGELVDAAIVRRARDTLRLARELAGARP